MRSRMVLCLVVALCASETVSARGHHINSRVAIGHAVTPDLVTPGGVRIYRDDSVPGGLRTDHDPPPSYDDPSRRGGG
jgi:hypothetical protein